MRNNPVQLLEDERQLIWPNDVPVDILVSIGTGIYTDRDGTIKSPNLGLRIAKGMTPKGLKGKLAVGYDMVQNTMDCNKIWEDFVASHYDRKHDCHRLNIGLTRPPPKIDAIDQISSLRALAERYLAPSYPSYIVNEHKSAHEHILAVARRLIAALFYFDREGPLNRETDTGILRCRLSSGMKIQFKNVLNEKPAFRVRRFIPHHGWEENRLRLKFDTNTFASDRISVDTQLSRGYVIQMTMPRWSIWECISGFKEPTL